METQERPVPTDQHKRSKPKAIMLASVRWTSILKSMYQEPKFFFCNLFIETKEITLLKKTNVVAKIKFREKKLFFCFLFADMQKDLLQFVTIPISAVFSSTGNDWISICCDFSSQTKKLTISIEKVISRFVFNISKVTFGERKAHK